MFDDKAVVRLLRRAERIGPAMGAYIRRVLEPHAKNNLRKAQGMLGFAERYGAEALETAAVSALSKRRLQLDHFRRLL